MNMADEKVFDIFVSSAVCVCAVCVRQDAILKKGEGRKANLKGKSDVKHGELPSRAFAPKIMTVKYVHLRDLELPQSSVCTSSRGSRRAAARHSRRAVATTLLRREHRVRRIGARLGRTRRRVAPGGLQP